MLGTAKYATMCSALFHIRVATRSSPVMPSSSRSAWASRAASSPIEAYETRFGASEVHVTTSAVAWVDRPCSSTRETNRGVGIIVERTRRTLYPLDRKRYGVHDRSS